MDKNNAKDFIRKIDGDFGKLTDTIFNAMLVKQSGPVKPLIELLNRYGIYGTQALKFIGELSVVSEIVAAQIKETEE